MSFFEEGFFISLKSSVTKWWRVIYKPLYKLTHFGKFPPEQDYTNSTIPTKLDKLKRPDPGKRKGKGKDLQEETNTDLIIDTIEDDSTDYIPIDPNEILDNIARTKDSSLKNIINSAKETSIPSGKVAPTDVVPTDTVPTDTVEEASTTPDNSATDEESLKRAQEIMERLTREANEDEAKKQAEIETAKEEAKKQAEELAKEQERAQEIIDRLAREANEDEAKKQAEIDAAKEQAKKQAEEQELINRVLNQNQFDVSSYIESNKNQ